MRFRGHRARVPPVAHIVLRARAHHDPEQGKRLRDTRDSARHEPVSRDTRAEVPLANEMRPFADD